MTKTKTGSKVFFTLIVVLSTASILLAELNVAGMISEMLIHARAHLSIIFLISAILMLVLRFYLLGSAQLLIVVLGLFPVFQSYSIARTCDYGDQTDPVRVLTHNILYTNKDYDAILRMIERVDPDIIILQETHQKSRAAMEPVLLERYPFYFSENTGYHPAYSAFYSKHPTVFAASQTLGNLAQGVLYARIKAHDNTLDIIGLHAKSPNSMKLIKGRKDHIEALGEFIVETNNTRDHLIVAGDFNNTPWHPEINRFLSKTGLRNTIVDKIFGTWPTFFKTSLLTVPIDHIFHSSNLMKTQYDTGGFTGSDHIPVISDFYFCK